MEKMNLLTNPQGLQLVEHFQSDELGNCSCGRAVRKINGSTISNRADGVRYARPDDTEGWCMFRCDECLSVIDESYNKPPESASIFRFGERP